jgi:hypothetical protein
MTQLDHRLARFFGAGHGRDTQEKSGPEDRCPEKKGQQH